MEIRLEIENFLVIQQDAKIKILGSGKNESIILNIADLACNIYNWSFKSKEGIVNFKDKKISTYAVKQVGKIQKKDAKTVIFSGFLSEIESDEDRTLPYTITFISEKDGVRILYDFGKKECLGAGVAYIKQKIHSNTVGCEKYEATQRMKLVFEKLEGEKFFGFGEQHTKFDMSNQSFRLCCSKKNSKEKKISSASPLPICITNKNRGFILNTNTIVDVDTGKKNNMLTFSIWDTASEIKVSFGPSISKIVAKQSSFLGKPNRLPSWTYGTILSLRGGIEHAEKILSKCTSQNIPVSAVYIEDWQAWKVSNSKQTVGWHCCPDETLYPNLKNWIKTLNDRDIKVLGSINSFVSVDPDCQMYREAHKNGYFLKHNDGSDYVCTHKSQTSYTYCQLDLSNQNTWTWLKEIINKNMIQNGFSGWLVDHEEYTPFDAVCESGDIVKYHCSLPVLWAKLNREIIEKTDFPDDFFIAHHSAWYESAKYGFSFWTDYNAAAKNQYREIAKNIIGILNAGMSGLLINHIPCNLPKDTEAFVRWCEFCAFSPIFRTATIFSDEEDFLNQEKYKIFAGFAQIHKKLFSYLEKTEMNAIKTGMPMMHPLFLQFPEDKQSWNISHQYMLGDSLLVAPVIKKKTKTIRVWLPAGKWQHIWSKKIFLSTGVYIQVSAALGKPPVFINLLGESATELQTLF